MYPGFAEPGAGCNPTVNYPFSTICGFLKFDILPPFEGVMYGGVTPGWTCAL
jgi:hypothetical protein